MQKSMGGDQSLDSCQIKVNVNFINNMFQQGEVDQLMSGALLDQFPQAKEYLEQTCASMHSEAAAQHEREQKLKFIVNGVLQQPI